MDQFIQDHRLTWSGASAMHVKPDPYATYSNILQGMNSNQLCMDYKEYSPQCSSTETSSTTLSSTSQTCPTIVTSNGSQKQRKESIWIFLFVYSLFYLLYVHIK